MLDPSGMIIVDVIVGLLFAAGLAGAVLPFLPGPLLILVGAWVYAAATGFAVVGTGRLVILAALTVVAYGLGHFAGALGARRYGASRWAMIGAILGALVGLFLGPFGLLIGPAAGAVGFELAMTGDLERSVRGGIGALVGIAVGAIAHFSIAVMMIGLFLWWVWRG